MAGQETPSVVPAWFGPAMLLLASAVVVLGIARGRRLGPVVTEPLPVVVRASETTTSRARLYRRSRDRARMTAILRTATTTRLRSALAADPGAPVEALLEPAAALSGLEPRERGGRLQQRLHRRAGVGGQGRAQTGGRRRAQDGRHPGPVAGAAVEAGPARRRLARPDDDGQGLGDDRAEAPAPGDAEDDDGAGQQQHRRAEPRRDDGRRLLARHEEVLGCREVPDCLLYTSPSPRD